MNKSSEGTELPKIEGIYNDRSSHAKELRNQGKKIIGYFCCAPVELVTAANLIPYRIKGNMKSSITRADAYIETMMCPFVRSAFDIAIQGGYDFLDGFVVSRGCDNTTIVYEIWCYNLKPAYSHSIIVPATTSAPSLEFYKEELRTFKRSLERFIGHEISKEHIQKAIQLHNKNRALVRDLYGLRKLDQPRLSGAEMIKMVIVNMSLPVEKGNELLEGVIRDVQDRHNGPPKRPIRLMIYGSEMDDPVFIEMVEELGANVVMDDICFGTRAYWHDVEMGEDPIEGLAKHYLEEITCPRTWRERRGTRKEELDDRFGHLVKFAKEWRVDGVILFIIRSCDNYAFDVPDVKDYLQKAGLKVLHIESDYSLGSAGQLKLRVQAFLEMIR